MTRLVISNEGTLLRDKSDEELMIAYQLGEAVAFGELYARHSPKMMSFIKGKVQNDALARDIFQSAFLKLHKSRRLYKGHLPFLPWLFTICRSELLDALKKPYRHNEELKATVSEVPQDSSCQQIAVVVETDALPAKQKMALELRYEQELSFEEIAAMLAVSPSNARKLVSRAVQFLRGQNAK